MSPTEHFEGSSAAGSPEIAEAFESAEQQRVLVAELNHRVRNMLQVVISIANQTIHRSTNLREFEEAFIGRMQALGRAYELLSREGWGRVSITHLAQTQLAPFATQGRRYSAQGAAIEIKPNAALALGLVFHELATNASKYGAFSAAQGSIDITWEMRPHEGDPPHLVLRWVESGGPQVQTPGRAGFGTELVRRQLRHELGGDASLEFRKDGLEVTLTLPARDAIAVGGDGI